MTIDFENLNRNYLLIKINISVNSKIYLNRC